MVVGILAHTLPFAATLYLLMAFFAFTRPPSAVNRLLYLVMIICAAWAFTYFQELEATTLADKLRWMRIRYLFVPPLSVLWLMVASELADLRTRFSWRFWAILFIFPLAIIPVALTMHLHDGFRHAFRLADAVTHMRPLLFDNGLWARLYETYGAVLQLASLVLLVRAARTASPLLRLPILLLILSSLIPIVGNITFFLAPDMFGGLNPAPILLFPAAAALASAVFRTSLLNLAPLARGLLFDHIHEGIVIADLQGTLIDLNATARHMLRLQDSPARKLASLHDLTSPWRDAFATSTCESRRLIACTTEDDQFWYERTCIPLVIENQPRGWLFVLQDVTAQRKLHLQQLLDLRQEEEAKRARQWSLLLRDMHDGVGAISANIGLLAELGRKSKTTADKDVFFTRIADLAREGNIEVRTMMNSLETRNLTWQTLFAEIRQYASLVLEPRGIAFSLTATGEPPCEPGMADGTSLFRILKEALTNSAKHAGPTQVQVELRFTENRLDLTIRDDGRWPGEVVEGRGLRHMRQRASDMGGTFNLITRPSTRITCSLPQKADPGTHP